MSIVCVLRPEMGAGAQAVSAGNPFHVEGNAQCRARRHLRGTGPAYEAGIHLRFDALPQFDRAGSAQRTERAPTGALRSVEFIWILRIWSGRVDSNHRPPGPEPDSVSVAGVCTGLQRLGGFRCLERARKGQSRHWLPFT